MKQAKTVTILAALACGIAGVADAGTKLATSWREPSAGPLKFKKVLVMVTAPYESQMQFGEAQLVALMKGTQGVAAHSVMSDQDARDKEKMRAYLEKEAFDGAVLMKFLGAGAEVGYQQGLYVPSYTGFWDYYSYAWPLVWDPGYVQMDRVLSMETTVFSMKDQKAVWSGITRSSNPKSARKLVDEVAQKVAADLKKQRLID